MWVIQLILVSAAPESVVVLHPDDESGSIRTERYEKMLRFGCGNVVERVLLKGYCGEVAVEMWRDLCGRVVVKM